MITGLSWYGWRVVQAVKFPRFALFFWLRSLTFSLLVGVWLLHRPVVTVAEPIAGELSRSHAAFLLSAARFTLWPAMVFVDNTSPLVFCVYKDPETGMALRERLLGETIKGRTLRQIDIDNFSNLSQCQVVYLPKGKILDYPLSSYATFGVLAISDCREFAENGGMLGFVRSDQGVDVFVNPEGLTSAGLSISPALLQMAELVRTRNKGPGKGPSGR
jgi:hypothetical protein